MTDDIERRIALELDLVGFADFAADAQEMADEAGSDFDTIMAPKIARTAARIRRALEAMWEGGINRGMDRVLGWLDDIEVPDDPDFSLALKELKGESQD